MRFLYRAITGSFLFVASVILLAVGGYQLHSAFSVPIDPPQMFALERDYEVRTQRVSLTSIAPEINTLGEIHSSRQLEIRTSSAGSIEELASQYYDGGVVEKGKLVYRLDPDNINSHLDKLKLSLSESRSELSESISSHELAREEVEIAGEKLQIEKTALARRQTLFEKKLISHATLEQAELTFNDSKQTVTALRRELLASSLRVDKAKHGIDKTLLDIADAKKQLLETSFIAPFRGVLSETSATIGARVNENEGIAVLVDPAALEVSFRLTEEDFVRLIDSTGNALSQASIRVDLDLAGRIISIPGKLDRLAPARDSSKGGYRLFGRLESVDRGLVRTGDVVSVAIKTNMVHGVVTLPTQSLSATDSVYVVDSDDRIRSRQVNVIHRDSGHAIVTGLNDGESVVLDPKEHHGPGVKVRVAKMTNRSESALNAERLTKVRVQQE